VLALLIPLVFVAITRELQSNQASISISIYLSKNLLYGTFIWVILKHVYAFIMCDMMENIKQG
jgi:hypothetical protein